MTSSSPHDDDGSGGDPSMEDILASIRRILSEDEPQNVGHAPPPPAAAAADSVLMLDPAMMLPEPSAQPTAAPSPAPAAAVTPAADPRHEIARVTPPPSLVAPEAAAATASSVGNLVRTLAAGRSSSMQVHAGGPTIEDLVREELRPILKQWLDSNLPVLVERLVRAEIERVVSRSAP